MKNILFAAIFLLLLSIITFSQTAPNGYTTHFGLRMWGTGATPTADSLNQNWKDIDSYIYNNLFNKLSRVREDTISAKIWMADSLVWETDKYMGVPTQTGVPGIGGIGRVLGSEMYLIWGYAENSSDTMVSRRYGRATYPRLSAPNTFTADVTFNSDIISNNNGTLDLSTNNGHIKIPQYTTFGRPNATSSVYHEFYFNPDNLALEYIGFDGSYRYYDMPTIEHATVIAGAVSDSNLNWDYNVLSAGDTIDLYNDHYAIYNYTVGATDDTLYIYSLGSTKGGISQLQVYDNGLGGKLFFRDVSPGGAYIYSQNNGEAYRPTAGGYDILTFVASYVGGNNAVEISWVKNYNFMADPQ